MGALTPQILLNLLRKKEEAQQEFAEVAANTVVTVLEEMKEEITETTEVPEPKPEPDPEPVKVDETPIKEASVVVEDKAIKPKGAKK